MTINRDVQEINIEGFLSSPFNYIISILHGLKNFAQKILIIFLGNIFPRQPRP